MKLYLVQHGESLEKEINPERPLSPKGTEDIKILAEFLSIRIPVVSTIFHSGKLRAKQTAELMALKITNKNGVQKLLGIEPTDFIAPIAYEIESWDEDTIVAGHLPFMAKLVSKLTTGDEAVSTVAYEPGSIVCLEKVTEKKWLILWMLRPTLLDSRLNRRINGV